jgi:hypothetical protein
MFFLRICQKECSVDPKSVINRERRKMKFDFGVLWNKGQNFKNISIGFDPLLELQY